MLENKCHINALELKAAKFAVLTFTRIEPSVQSIHIQMDNAVSLSYLVKMGAVCPQQNSLRYKQRDLGLLAGQRDHIYSRTPCMCSQQENRFPAVSKERLKQI